MKLILFLIYANGLRQSLSDSDSYLYDNDTSIFYQHIDVLKIKVCLNKESSMLCEWFCDNKLSIYFGEDKTKCFLFSETICYLNISCRDHDIKQFILRKSSP